MAPALTVKDDIPKAMPELSAADRRRFMTKVVMIDGDGCWLWTGWKNEKGYGRFDICQKRKRRRHGRSWLIFKRYAHRVMWTIAFGEIPPSFEVNHLCEIESCVRPDHLECLPWREHMEFTYQSILTDEERARYPIIPI